MLMKLVKQKKKLLCVLHGTDIALSLSIYILLDTYIYYLCMHVCVCVCVCVCLCVCVCMSNLGREERGHVILQPRTCEWELRDSQISVPEHITCVCVCVCARARVCECIKFIVMPVGRTRMADRYSQRKKNQRHFSPVVYTCLA